MKSSLVRVRAAPIRDRLRALYAAGETLPALAVGEYRVGFVPINGSLSVSEGGRYLGAVRSTGRFWPSSRARESDIGPLKGLLERPLEAIKTAARLARERGLPIRCATCGRDLSPDHGLVGLGPACFRKGKWYQISNWRDGLPPELIDEYEKGGI